MDETQYQHFICQTPKCGFVLSRLDPKLGYDAIEVIQCHKCGQFWDLRESPIVPYDCKIERTAPDTRLSAKDYYEKAGFKELEEDATRQPVAGVTPPLERITVKHIQQVITPPKKPSQPPAKEWGGYE